MIVVLRGKPGVGKTTLVSKVMKEFEAVGFYTKEVRNSQGRRVGFDIVLHNGRTFVLARKSEGKPRVGKYRVFAEELEKALEMLGNVEGKILFVDEIGKMESLSLKFQRWLFESAEKATFLLATGPYIDIPLLRKFMIEFNPVIYNVSERNRNELVEILKNLIRETLEKSSF